MAMSILLKVSSRIKITLGNYSFTGPYIDMFNSVFIPRLQDDAGASDSAGWLLPGPRIQNPTWTVLYRCEVQFPRQTHKGYRYYYLSSINSYLPSIHSSKVRCFLSNMHGEGGGPLSGKTPSQGCRKRGRGGGGGVPAPLVHWSLILGP